MWVTGEYYDSLRDVETAARGRLGEMQPEPFDRLDWFKRSWECEPLGHRPLVVRARVSGAEAWLFFVRDRPHRLAPLAGPHTPRFAPIFVGDPEPPVQHLLLRAAARRLRMFGIARVEIGPLIDAHAALIRHAFHRTGWSTAERRGPTVYGLYMQGRSFDDYFDALPDTLHEQIAAGARALSVEIADLLSPRLQDELDLLAGRDHFLRELAQDATLDRTLRLGIARVGDAPVAAQLWTVEPGRAWRHWSVEDKDARHLAPTAQLTASLLRYVINIDHVQAIDLGTGHDAELAPWAEQHSRLTSLTLFNRRRLANWAPALGARLGGLVRRPSLD